MRRLVAILAVTLAAAACAGDETEPAPGLDELTVTADAGFEIVAVRSGLDGPTQLTIDPASGRWLVAELAGEENDATGRVRSLSPIDAGDVTVLIEGLDKPTGVTVADSALWIMERNRLSVAPLADDARSAGSAEVRLDDLPFNGRSQGTLRTTGDGSVMFNTSGRLSAGAVVPGSGELRVLGPDGTEQVVATGFKHAYATVELSDGRVVVAEVGDGRFDGEVPPDELVVLVPGADHGWPDCIGDNVAVRERDATEARCAEVPGSLALFEPGATPTSIAVAPWDDTELLVALWVSGELVGVSVDDGSTRTLITGLSGPQDLTVDGSDVLLVEHRRDRVLRLAPTG